MAEQKITEAAVLNLFREDKVSISKGAQLLGIPIQDFMDLLYANSISLDDETPKEMEENLRNLQVLFKLRRQTKRRKQYESRLRLINTHTAGTHQSTLPTI